ncbi:hypothetical protein PFISCL1PPCAC_25266, partial [Pristionchus fissidentatus]
DDGMGGDTEVYCSMLQLNNHLDGFKPRGNIKVRFFVATNRPDTLDPALVRPSRLDRKVKFALPDMAGHSHTPSRLSSNATSEVACSSSSAPTQLCQCDTTMRGGRWERAKKRINGGMEIRLRNQAVMKMDMKRELPIEEGDG